MKIITIVITVIIVAGAATGVGIIVKQNNDKHMKELVNSSVSQTLATTEEKTTIAETTTEESTTRRSLNAPQPTTTTEESQSIIIYDKNEVENHPTATVTFNNKYEVEEKTPEVVEKEKGIETPIGRVYKSDSTKHQDENGCYWETNFTYIPNQDSGKYYHYYIDENNKLFYFNDNCERTYYQNQN